MFRDCNVSFDDSLCCRYIFPIKSCASMGAGVGPGVDGVGANRGCQVLTVLSFVLGLA